MEERTRGARESATVEVETVSDSPLVSSGPPQTLRGRLTKSEGLATVFLLTRQRKTYYIALASHKNRRRQTPLYSLLTTWAREVDLPTISPRTRARDGLRGVS